MATSTIIGAWVAAGLTLFIYSFLYKDNPFFRFGEHLYIGVSVGYGLAILIFKSMAVKWWEPLFVQKQWSVLIPTAFGLLMLTRLIPKLAWLSRWSFAFVIGFGAGVTIPREISARLLRQTQSTVVPLISKGSGGLSYGFGDLNGLLVVVGVLAVLTYFFFSVEHKGPVKGIAKIGILFLMVSFGASFGYTVMARISLLFGRFYDLITYSSRSYAYATPILLAVLIAGLALYRRAEQRSQTASEETS